MSKIIPLNFIVLLGIIIMTYGYTQASQNNDTLIKHQLNIDGGVHFPYLRNYNEKKYFSGYPTPAYNGYTAQIYDPKFSGQIGIWYNYYFKKKLVLKLGISYFNRIMHYEANKDTILKYLYRNSSNGIVSMKRSAHNIEIPVLLGYQIAKFQMSFGIRKNINIITQKNEERLNGKKYYYKERSKPYLSYYKSYYLHARVNYSFKIKEQTLSLYFAANRLSKSSYDFLIGFEFPFINIIKK